MVGTYYVKAWYYPMYEHGLYLAIILSALPLSVSLIVGLIISVLQAATQIQESTLTFVPKLVAVILTLYFAGSWMIAQMVDYSSSVFKSIELMQGLVY